MSREAGEYHLYVTNGPAEKLAAEIGASYSLRWQVELLFRQLIFHYRLEDMPSSNKVVVEAMLYMAFLTIS